MPPIKKILIIGSGGAGKSTLAAELGGILGLEVTHLDAHFWSPGWVPTPRPQWIETVEKLKSRDAWIMDGHYGSTLEMRLEASDAVVFLDFPKIICVWRAIRRRFQNTGVSRPDMAPGCPERFLHGEFLKFLLWIWRFPRVESPSVVRRLRGYSDAKRIIILRRPKDVRRFMEEVRVGGLEGVTPAFL